MTDKEILGEFEKIYKILGVLIREIGKNVLKCNHSELDKTSKEKYRCGDCGNYFKVEAIERREKK